MKIKQKKNNKVKIIAEKIDSRVKLQRFTSYENGKRKTETIFGSEFEVAYKSGIQKMTLELGLFQSKIGIAETPLFHKLKMPMMRHWLQSVESRKRRKKPT